jgi:polysaccharide biosynthesis protein PslG
MSTKHPHPLKRCVVRVAVPLASIAVPCAAAGYLVPAHAATVTYPVAETAAIVQSNTTLGVSDPYLYFDTQAQINQALATMQSMGVNDVRIDIPWAGVEPVNGVYNWSTIDMIVKAAAARGMGIDAVLNDTPSWAVTPGTPAISGAPASPAQFAAFASAVASRYGQEISAYEIWNEPNSIASYDPINPETYTQLLQAAYPAIKKANPNAIVIGGVVGSTLTWGNLTMNPVNFVQAMYADGAKGYFDALSFHPYQQTLPFTAGGSVPNSPLLQLEAIEQLMVANGDGSKQIWATEYGESTAGSTQLNQAQYILNFLQGWSSISYTGPVFIHTLYDLNSSSTDTNLDDQYGLFTANGTPKLAVQVIEWWTANHPQTTVAKAAVTMAVAAPAAAASLVGAVAQGVMSGLGAAAADVAAAMTPTPKKTTVSVSAATVTPAVSSAVTSPTKSTGVHHANAPAKRTLRSHD